VTAKRDLNLNNLPTQILVGITIVLSLAESKCAPPTMQRRHSPRPYPQLVDFVGKLLPLNPSSIPSRNNTNTSEVLDGADGADGADGPPDEEQWPSFRPVDLMEFMSLGQATGALLIFSILTVQSLSRPGWIFYRLPWLLN
jgi:hypothetical protein